MTYNMHAKPDVILMSEIQAAWPLTHSKTSLDAPRRGVVRIRRSPCPDHAQVQDRHDNSVLSSPGYQASIGCSLFPLCLISGRVLLLPRWSNT